MDVGTNRMNGFNKHQAIKLWVEEHHPNLLMRFEVVPERLGFVLIGNDQDLLNRAGSIEGPTAPCALVEINFDVRDFRSEERSDWFFNYNTAPKKGWSAASGLESVTASIFSPDYFPKLEEMLKNAGLI